VGTFADVYKLISTMFILISEECNRSGDSTLLRLVESAESEKDVNRGHIAADNDFH
jgi:hypothetical protein